MESVPPAPSKKILIFFCLGLDIRVPEIEKPAFKRTPIAVVVNRTLEETGLSLRQLAKLTGLCPTTLCHYRNGQREPQGRNYDHVVNVLNGVLSKGTISEME